MARYIKLCGESLSSENYGLGILRYNKIIKTIPDIFECESIADEFVKMCNSLAIEESQIDYLIEDYLTDFSV